MGDCDFGVFLNNLNVVTTCNKPMFIGLYTSTIRCYCSKQV